MPDEKLIETLVKRWSGLLAVPPGASDVDLLAFETRLGLRFPKSFRRYLLQVNGMANGGSSSDLVHFWTLTEIEQHLAEPESRLRYPFIPFADYSVNCWVWVLPLDSGGDVRDTVFTYGPPLEACAPNFVSFLARYLGGDDLTPKRLDPRTRAHWKSH
jgi:hypothetical protein